MSKVLSLSWRSMLSRMAFAIAGVCVADSAFADGETYWATEPVTCHWIGSVQRGMTFQSDYDEGSYPIPSEAYADWTNQNNWAEGIVPGLVQVPQPDGSILTNGSRGCTAVFNGDCMIRVIALEGHVSVGNIRVTGATAPRFVFGRWKWSNPFLCIESGGRIDIDADVPEAPFIKSHIMPFEVPAVADQTMLTIANNSPSPLDIGYIGSIYPAFDHWVGVENIRYEGTGEIRKRNKTYISNWGAKICLAQDGGKYVVDSAPSADYGFGSVDNAYYISVDADAPRQHIEVPAGKAMSLDQNAVFDSVQGDLLIDGTGTIRFGEDKDGATASASYGRTLEIACRIEVCSGRGLKVGNSGRTGTVRLSGGNAFTSLNVANGAVCEVSSIGNAGEDSPVGIGTIGIANRAVFRYAGDGETTDRTLCGNGYGTIEVASDGDLVWKGEIRPDTEGSLEYSYSVKTPMQGRFVIAAPSVTKYLELSDGANVGFAAPDGSDTIRISKLNVAGVAALDVPAGVKVEIASLTRSSGSGCRLDIRLADGGKVSVEGFDGGAMPVWVTVNGCSAYRDGDGMLFTAHGLPNAHEIAAHGDKLPNAPLQAVGITSVGDASAGDDTLAGTSVSVFALNHEVAEPVTLAVESGESLDVRLVRVRSGAGGLTIGRTAGVGEVKSSAGALDLETSDKSQRITINARLANPKDVPFKTSGPGTVRLSSLRDAAGVDAAELVGDGTFDLSAGSLRLSESAADGVSAKVEASSPAKIDAFGGMLRLVGDMELPVEKILVGTGELVLNGPRLVAPSASIGTDDSAKLPMSMEVGTTNQVGILRVEGGSFTGRLVVASYGSEKTRGAVYQSGGEVVNVTPYAETDTIGVHGYAYYELTGGRYVAAGDWYIGDDGEGLMSIFGAELWHTPGSVRRGRFRLGNSTSRTQLLIGNGGTFNATNVQEAIVFPGYNRLNASGQITVEDGGRLLCNEKGISIGFGSGTEETCNVVNLNSGGVVASSSIGRGPGYVYKSEEWPEGTATNERFTNTYAYVNCNGGIFRCMAWGAVFGDRGNQWTYPPNRITAYEGGLTVDTAGRGGGLGWGGGLQAPSGMGVVSVAWTPDDAEWFAEQGMVGPPIVRIVGDGKGATAVADFDSLSGRVTAIRVTGFGNDYTMASAQLIWNKTVRRTLPCSLAVCRSGGLTKVGAGYLNLNATNTYTGATVVRGGTLRLMCDNVISPSSALVLDGGVLDMNGHSQSFSDIVCNGGSVVNGTPSVTGLVIDFDDVRNGVVRKVDVSLFEYADGATLRLVNEKDGDFADADRRYRLVRFVNGMPANGLDLTPVQSWLPERWIVRVIGNGISISRIRGSVVVLR